MNKCIVLGDENDWQQRAELAEAMAMTLQSQRDAAEAETAQALEALTIAREGRRIFEADVAALMDALGAIGHMARHADRLSLQSIDAYSRRVLACDRSTALLAELEAARAVVVAARNYLSRETSLLPIDKSDVDAIGALLGAVRAYNEAMEKTR